MIKFDFSTYMDKYIDESKLEELSKRKEEIKEKLYSSNMSGWLDINNIISEEEFNKIKDLKDLVEKTSDVFIVIGIGGSYMGSYSIKEIYTPYFNNNPKVEVIYAGNNLSSKYIKELIEYIKDKEVTINVISKSGTTMEPNIIYDILKEELKKKYNETELRKRIIITTDKENGSLREEVNKEGYTSFIVPNNIGGRYSVLTAVGLLPLAISEININELLIGAKEAEKAYDLAFKYASIRNILYNNGKYIENFSVYEPRLYYFTEWLKQLFGETEGKENKGILPISTVNTRDLHSLGQYLQEGKDIVFETVLRIQKQEDIIVNDKYTLNELNNIVADSVAKAHFDEYTPTNMITIEELDYKTLGKLIYFFELSAAISGYLLNIDPFNQPGVEKYKQEVKKNI